MCIVHVEQPDKLNFGWYWRCCHQAVRKDGVGVATGECCQVLSFSTTSFGICASLIIVGQLNTCDRIVLLEIISEPRDVQTVLDGRSYAVLSGSSSSFQIIVRLRRKNPLISVFPDRLSSYVGGQWGLWWLCWFQLMLDIFLITKQADLFLIAWYWWCTWGWWWWWRWWWWCPGPGCLPHGSQAWHSSMSSCRRSWSLQHGPSPSGASKYTYTYNTNTSLSLQHGPSSSGAYKCIPPLWLLPSSSLSSPRTSPSSSVCLSYWPPRSWSFWPPLGIWLHLPFWNCGKPVGRVFISFLSFLLQ